MRRKKSHAEEESHERWLVSYADFITLLFAFFVVMYATSQKDLEKQEDFEKSIKKYLIKGAGVSLGGVNGATKRVKDFEDKDTLIKTPIKNFRRMAPEKSQETLNVKKSIERRVEKEISESAIVKYIRDIEVGERGVLISLYSDKIFSKKSAKIFSSSAKFLDQLGPIISDFKGPIHVLGHSNHSGLSKTKYSSEWEFSSDRSIKLLRYISKRFGISEKQMVASAFGDTQPLFDNKKDFHKNNRVEILLVTQ